MGGKLLTLSIALLLGGCAARLPVEERVAPSLATPSTLLAAVPAPQDDVWGSGPRLSMVNVSLVPCGLECGEAEEEEEFKRHEVAVFVGFTAERGEGGPTIGLDYTYWINERFGVGPFVDYVAGELQALAFGAGVWFRPFGRVQDLAFSVAPGMDITREEEHGETSWEASALLRLGVVYGFSVGRGFRLLPSFYVDLIAPDKQAYVMGLSIAKEF